MGSTSYALLSMIRERDFIRLECSCGADDDDRRSWGRRWFLRNLSSERLPMNPDLDSNGESSRGAGGTCVGGRRDAGGEQRQRLASVTTET